MPRNNKRPSGRRQRQAGFTLAEVLAALLFMAIVIPVAVEGLHIASVGAEVAARKSHAARIAENVLNENSLSGSSALGQSGSVVENGVTFEYNVRTEEWSGDTTTGAPRQLTAEVTFKASDREFVVRLSTLGGTQ